MDISTNAGLSVIETENFEDNPLSYDDTPYEEQLPTSAEAAALASRIGSAKVYLLSESSASTARSGKRKRDDETEGDVDETDEDVEMDGDPTLRGNALLLSGTPISSLPTARLFAYATHFDAHPMGLEWVNDTTCVFVFSSKVAARTGLRYLSKSFGEEPDSEGFITAKPIPVAFWPPEERINNSLGTAGQSAMKGIIRMRWAKVDDVKKRGAKVDSEFYRKHGRMAGKELFNGRELPLKKRRRSDFDDRNGNGNDAALRKEQLDEELDGFLAEGEAEDAAAAVLDPPSPPSKMRSDYIASDGRTMLENHSRPDLASRLMAALPRRAAKRRRGSGEGSGLEDRLWSDKVDLSERIGSEKSWGRRNGRRNRTERSGRTRDRPKKSQQELDDELDAFLKEE